MHALTHLSVGIYTHTHTHSHIFSVSLSGFSSCFYQHFLTMIFPLQAFRIISYECEYRGIDHKRRPLLKFTDELKHRVSTNYPQFLMTASSAKLLFYQEYWASLTLTHSQQKSCTACCVQLFSSDSVASMSVKGLISQLL